RAGSGALAVAAIAGATAFKREAAPEAEPALHEHAHDHAAAEAYAAAAAPVRDRAQKAAEARMKGYEGEACGECGNFTMVRNGTCLKCDTCGSTSGCS
ncbi:hypothetical protein, partial [Propylenella binzhouense]